MVEMKTAQDLLVEAWRNGRPIVPFIGSGVSVGSGFPVTSQLRDYLAKVSFFIRRGIYRRLQGEECDTAPAFIQHSFEQNPSEYLMRYGWPDYSRLTADLWWYAQQPRLAKNSPIDVDPKLEGKAESVSRLIAQGDVRPSHWFRIQLHASLHEARSYLLKNPWMRSCRRYPPQNSGGRLGGGTSYDSRA